MSTYKAIAGVSSTLRVLLNDRMTEAVDGITIAPPDVTVNNISGRRLNLYLYQVEENGHLKNQEIPGVGHGGTYGNPPLSLDLHYLFTSFGSSETAPDADLEAQQILGDAMRVLHDFAIVGADLVQEKTLGNPPILDPSLIDEFEQVKVTLEPKSVDEISKIWTALPKVNFRRSVAYFVSVVQIESQKPRALALPVRQRKVYAFPLASPYIQQLFRQPPLNVVPVAEAEEGETLRAIGNNLRASNTRVNIDQTDAPITAIQSQQLDFTIPANQFKIGLHTVEVVQDLLLTVVNGQPPEKHPGFRSNAVGFMLLPHLVDVNPKPSAGPGDTVTVTVSPKVFATQQKFLLLGDIVVPAVPAKFDSPPSSTIDFVLPKAPDAVIPAGTYLLRVRVDGAETRLTTDPLTKQYSGPTYQIT
jgi:hypothetical protein